MFQENIIQQHPESVECEGDLAGNVVKHIDSPIAPVDSSSGSAQSEMSTSGVMSEEINSRGDPETNTGEMAMSIDLSFYLLTA